MPKIRELNGSDCAFGGQAILKQFDYRFADAFCLAEDVQARGGDAMRLPRRSFLHLAAAAAALPAVSRIARGQVYPTRPVHIIVGYAPAGPADISARLLGEKFSAAWNQPVVIENVAGANGNIAGERVARAAPDGYTLIMAATSQITVNPSIYERMNFDPAKDLAPVSQAVFTPNVLTVNTDLPAKSVQELVALARSQPGKLTFGSAGVGSSQHLAGELFKAMGHLDLQHVPYRGAAPAVTDLLGGRISMFFANITAVLPLVRERKLRALAVTSLRRSGMLPDVATMAESGFPGFEATASFGLFVPTASSSTIIDKIYRETVRSLADADTRQRLGDLGMEVIASSPGEYSAVIKNETVQWSNLIKQIGLRASD